MDRSVRVRFAPSPTGALHIGGVRTALYNYLFAKKQGGDFIIRIEDTDQTRFVPGAEEYIIESLKWLGIEANEGIGFGDGPYAPYRQSERKHIYKEYAMQLLEAGHAYYAFDTAEDLSSMRDRLKATHADAKYDPITRSSMKNSLTLPEDEVKRRLESGEHYVIRYKLPLNEEVKLFDEIRGWVSFNTNQMDDKVLFKSDGMPTYHLANVVDDYLMNISHVIRGEEWLSSAPLHVLLYRSFGWEAEMPKFAHLPLLLKPEGNGKLSKRDGDRLGFPVFPINWVDPITQEVSTGYRESGYLPQAVVNLLAMLGWNPGTDQEIFSMDELIEAFTLERVSKSGAKFDPNKAKWYNQQYVHKMKDEDFVPFVHKALVEHGLDHAFDEKYLLNTCRLIKEKISFTKELWDYGRYFFIDPEHYDEMVVKKRWNDNIPALLKDLIQNFSSMETFTQLSIETVYQETLNKNGIAGKDFLQLFRVCLTGVSGGPQVFEIAELLGKEKTCKRIQNALEKIKI
ncbi:MAG: glutamate--tRNA ligase [Bacteroidota bacterium]|nr:glutamate--tRNA ligase [Bacteroidota bacterium]